MNDILTNQLNMIGACIATATTPEHMLVWNGQEPADFAADLNVFQTHYGQARDVAYLAGSATTGSANAKDVAETALENLAFQMARALAGHYKKSGNLINRAKVNIRLGALQKLRDQALVTRSIEIRDLANSATAEPGASTRGITTARINLLTAAINTYADLLNSPRSAIVDRSMHLRDLTTRIAALMEEIRDLDTSSSSSTAPKPAAASSAHGSKPATS